MKKWAIVILVLILSAPALSRADDTEIYGTVTNTSLEPNVLIIFDSSGSMDTADVPGEPYQPFGIYAGSYDTNAVYVRERVDHHYEWNEFAPSVYDICLEVQTLLLQQGYASAQISGERFNYACADRGQPKTLRLGRYLNYIESGVVHCWFLGLFG